MECFVFTYACAWVALVLLFAWNAGAGENGLNKMVRAVELVLDL